MSGQQRDVEGKAEAWDVVSGWDGMLGRVGDGSRPYWMPAPLVEVEMFMFGCSGMDPLEGFVNPLLRTLMLAMRP